MPCLSASSGVGICGKRFGVSEPEPFCAKAPASRGEIGPREWRSEDVRASRPAEKQVGKRVPTAGYSASERPPVATEVRKVAFSAEASTPSTPDTLSTTRPPSDRGLDAAREGDGSEHDVTSEDLEWVSTADESGLEFTRKLSSAIEAGRALSRVVTEHSIKGSFPSVSQSDDQLEGPSHRVQVHFDDGWHDVFDKEARAILDHLADGETEFRLQARGNEYSYDFKSLGEAFQINVRTGKRRRLRVLDGPGTDEIGDCAPGLPQEVAEQRNLGPQSKRGGACQAAIAKYLDGNKHAQACFQQFERNEEKYCGEWAVFYHSYSFAALLYEVHAAVASALFRFRSQYAALPRILVHEFNEIPDATTLIHRFNTEFAEHKRDHNPAFRKVGISAMCSLASTGPEACVARVFVSGYSCKDVSFSSVLEKVLESVYVPPDQVQKVAAQIIRLSEKHGLDVSQFGGKPCRSQKAGHLLQIFIKRHLVDHLAYAAEPYGPLDLERMPLSNWMNSDSSFNRGQARIVAHPKFFMQANSVRLFVASADPTFHKNRAAFQEELCHLIRELAVPELRERAATGIYGGTLPSWWTAEDQRKLA